MARMTVAEYAASRGLTVNSVYYQIHNGVIKRDNHTIDEEQADEALARVRRKRQDDTSDETVKAWVQAKIFAATVDLEVEIGKLEECNDYISKDEAAAWNDDDKRALFEALRYIPRNDAQAFAAALDLPLIKALELLRSFLAHAVAELQARPA